MLYQNQFQDIYKNKKVFLTGHTGFKGSWLTLWLTHLGAEVYGYSLRPPTEPSMFDLLNLRDSIHHKEADVRDYAELRDSINRVRPDIIFHLAAQSVIGESYIKPIETVQTNVLGTANVMDAVRESGIETAMIMVTSDKSYKNEEGLQGYRENDPLGGYDPYSGSKAAAEILIQSWRSSFFNPDRLGVHGVKVASVRSGNVVGGGDWTKDQIVPDCIRSLQNERAIKVRSPYATRPWLHVLEPLWGYLLLGARLIDPLTENPQEFCEPFNFGPAITANKSVRELVEKIIAEWGNGSWKHVYSDNAFHESTRLSLAIDKSYHKLQWFPRWSFDETIKRTVAWYKVLMEDPSGIRDFSLEQILEYQGQRLRNWINDKNTLVKMK
jgi:CDP-glucose 4,6-dehydratase